MKEDIPKKWWGHPKKRRILVALLSTPYLAFLGLLFFTVLLPEEKIIYPPVSGKFLGWIFLGILISAPIVLFILFKRKHVALWILTALISACLCLFSGLGILFSPYEVARIEHEGSIFTIVDFVQENGSAKYCIHEKENIFLSTEIDCLPPKSVNFNTHMLSVDDSLLVFFDGKLVYIFGKNSFSTTWLDSALYNNSLFHLSYKESREGIVYELHKCNINNTKCNRQPFYYSTRSLQYAKLNTSAYQSSLGFFVDIGTDYIDSDFIYKYSEEQEPACLVEGCELK